jgi:hypothetical protein
MSYNAIIKFCYVNDTETSSNKYFPEIVDKQTITIEAPAQDLNTHQYFELFKSFLRAVGFDEYGIMDGACRVAFNDCNRQDDMEKLMGEYDLQDKQTYTDDDYEALQRKVKFLEAENSRLRNPDAVNYTDEELDVMTDDIIYKSWGNLVPGSPEAVANFCSCPVMDNAEMPNDKKWVNGDCPLHGTGKKTPEELAQGHSKIPQDAL